MEHKYEKNIKCPYCDWEDQDSWEFQEDSGTCTCGSCQKEFNVEREIEITYNTSRIDCEENETEHEYQFESVFEKRRKYENGTWILLPESQWTYTRIMMCSICGDKDYIDINKEEFLKELNKQNQPQ